MDAQVKKLMLTQSFNWQSVTTIDGAGDATHAIAEALKGYQVISNKLVVDKTGAKKKSFSHVFFNSVDIVRIAEGDLLEIVSVSRTHVILKVDMYYREYGALDYGVAFL